MTAAAGLPPIVYYPGSGKPAIAPAPIVPAIPPAALWSRTQLVTAGYSTPEQWLAYTGVQRSIRSVVWHDMEGFLAGAIQRWNTGVASAQLCILRSGEIILTVKPENVAWHAGTNNLPGTDGYGRTPFWRQVNINPYSLGVELEGFVAATADHDGGYTALQIASAVRAATWLFQVYGITLQHTYDQINGHHTHAEISSTRSDPGPLFDLDDVLLQARNSL